MNNFNFNYYKKKKVRLTIANQPNYLIIMVLDTHLFRN